jgi:hypothetical protein
MEVHVARSLKWLGAVGLLLGLLTRPAAAAEKRTFGLIVGNNRSLSLAQPDLQYADDDAARYYRLFHALGPGAQVELLTSFDRVSARLYPNLRALAHPATRSELTRAVARLRASLLEARSRGEDTQLYFVFAGHGEVAGGRGYLQLEDERIDGAFIEREIIDKLPAATKHVLLDSCNSFFVINPRKPGGRRWATPKDMALGFSARHPEVGLFLSTNSDEEVFEWSELESGVFSHEVRSGLMGAADVDQDGSVSYAELGGFVAEANRGITREGLRPQVFFSGPRGDKAASLFPIRALRGRRVALGDPQARVWARDASGERLLDLHKERGAFSFTLPDAESELSLFVQTATAGPRPQVLEHHFAAGSEPLRLDESPGESPRLAARGEQLFGSLFASPYGPSAYASFIQESASHPEPVFGISRDDVTRMNNYLTALSDVDSSQRKAVAVGLGASGLIFAGLGVGGQFAEPKMNKGLSLGLIGAGAAFAGTGLWYALSDGPGEKARKTFEMELRAQRGNHALAFAHTEERLRDVADSERHRRQASFWLVQGLALGLAGVTTIGLVNDDKPQAGTYGYLYGSSALLSGLGFFILSMETPTERILRLYHDDPGIKLRAGVSAVPGGFGFGLSGTF